MICFLEEWGPPYNWGGVWIPEVVELALRKIGDPLGDLSAHVAAETVAWMFIAALERVMKERDVLQQEVAEEEHELWDA